jgi:hypothetical protein
MVFYLARIERKFFALQTVQCNCNCAACRPSQPENGRPPSKLHFSRARLYISYIYTATHKFGFVNAASDVDAPANQAHGRSPMISMASIA